jgi:hypothetical protein
LRAEQRETETFAPEGSAAATMRGDDDNRSGSISNPNHDLLVAASALRTRSPIINYFLALFALD